MTWLPPGRAIPGAGRAQRLPARIHPAHQGAPGVVARRL